MRRAAGVSGERYRVGRMAQRILHGFVGLSRPVRFLWLFAAFEALSIGLRLAGL